MRPKPVVVDRETAHAQGRTRFYTGVICKRGHDAERFVANGGCCACSNWARRGPSGRNVKHAMLIFSPYDTEEEMAFAVKLASAFAANLYPIVVRHPIFKEYIAKGWTVEAIVTKGPFFKIMACIVANPEAY